MLSFLEHQQIEVWSRCPQPSLSGLTRQRDPSAQPVGWEGTRGNEILYSPAKPETHVLSSTFMQTRHKSSDVFSRGNLERYHSFERAPSLRHQHLSLSMLIRTFLSWWKMDNNYSGIFWKDKRDITGSGGLVIYIATIINDFVHLVEFYRGNFKLIFFVSKLATHGMYGHSVWPEYWMNIINLSGHAESQIVLNNLRVSFIMDGYQINSIQNTIS